MITDEPKSPRMADLVAANVPRVVNTMELLEELDVLLARDVDDMPGLDADRIIELTSALDAIGVMARYGIELTPEADFSRITLNGVPYLYLDES